VWGRFCKCRLRLVVPVLSCSIDLVDLVLFQTARATFMLPISLWPANGIFKLVGSVCNALG
jgi:hypothetical protein